MILLHRYTTLYWAKGSTIANAKRQEINEFLAIGAIKREIKRFQKSKGLCAQDRIHN